MMMPKSFEAFILQIQSSGLEATDDFYVLMLQFLVNQYFLQLSDFICITRIDKYVNNWGPYKIFKHNSSEG